MQAKRIPLSKLVANTGQIEGLPKNPRSIRDEKFAKLVQSLKDDPEMLDLRELLVYPLEKKFVVIGGNMRLLAMRDLGFKEASCKVLDKATPAQKLRAYAIKDNVGYGDHDWDALANEWDAAELADWGMDLPTDFGGQGGGLTDPDEVPEDVPSRAKKGDRWNLGQHLLVVGDSSDPEIEALLKPSPYVVVLDPPYELNAKKWQKWIQDPCIFFGVGKTLTLIPHDLYRFERVIHKTYKNRIASTQVEMRHAIVVQVGSVKTCPQSKQGFPSIVEQEHGCEHQHQKPATLIAEHLKHWTAPDLVVVDPFAGSGSSFIAAELSGSRCVGVELDPAVADVAIHRWEMFTGQTAERQVN